MVNVEPLPQYSTHPPKTYVYLEILRRGPAAILGLTLLSGYIITLIKAQTFTIHVIKQTVKVSDIQSSVQYWVCDSTNETLLASLILCYGCAICKAQSGFTIIKMFFFIYDCP